MWLKRIFIYNGGGDRTHDLTGMNRTLSPAELRRQFLTTRVMIHKNRKEVKQTGNHQEESRSTRPAVQKRRRPSRREPQHPSSGSEKAETIKKRAAAPPSGSEKAETIKKRAAAPAQRLRKRLKPSRREPQRPSSGSENAETIKKRAAAPAQRLRKSGDYQEESRSGYAFSICKTLFLHGCIINCDILK